LLRTFMRDIGNQLVLGTFTSTFLYCLLVLRTIRETESNSIACIRRRSVIGASQAGRALRA
jgi:uncharacterized membrane protein